MQIYRIPRRTFSRESAGRGVENTSVEERLKGVAQQDVLDGRFLRAVTHSWRATDKSCTRRLCFMSHEIPIRREK